MTRFRSKSYLPRGGFARLAALAMVSATLCLSGSARAGLWPLVFGAGSDLTNQQFSVTPSVNGDVTLAAKVLIFNIPQQTESLSSVNAPTTSSHPRSLDQLGTGDYGGGSLSDIDSIHLDFLNGQTADLAIDPVPFVATKLGFVILYIDAKLTGLTFQLHFRRTWLSNHEKIREI